MWPPEISDPLFLNITNEFANWGKTSLLPWGMFEKIKKGTSSMTNDT